jgi:large subunit ribosomal protein L13
MKTIQPKQMTGDQRKWFIIDATDMILGRLATEVAVRLRGKLKVDFAPHVDNGDYVIVINCDKFQVTGNKLASKLYRRHT